MYIEDIFYANIEVIRDFFGMSVAISAAVWVAVKASMKGMAFICETFGITEK